MVYTYAGRKECRYPYYLCLNAQRRGWAACPAKSLPAHKIEDSVLGQIRQAQGGIFEPAAWDRMDRIRQVEAIRAVVERVGYDGAARRISIRFRALATGAEEQA
jgi:site-specific DNA recombinase